MLEVCELLGVRASRVLELAAGPAAHARWFAHQPDTQRVCAVDLSREMVAYGQGLANEEGCALTYIEGDMRQLDRLGLEPVSFDLAFCLLDSISYLTGPEDLAHHLEALATVMRPGGVYVIVASHPRDAVGNEPSTETRWTVEVDERKIEVEFGVAEDPELDPVSFTRMTTVRIKEWRGEELLNSLEERSAMKTYLFPELYALIASSPFELVQTWGAMRADVPLDMSPEAWRMVLALRLR